MKRIIFVSVLICMLVSIANAGKSKPEKSCNCVVFRLDDIQDHFYDAAQTAIMDVFKENLDPISVGVIAKDYGKDKTITNYLKSALTTQGWDFEVVNHGWIHEDFADGLSLEQQTKLLSDSVAKTLNDLEGYISKIDIFIPPFNSWNSNTAKALVANGFKIISAQVETDEGSYPFEAPRADGLFHWPIGASTNDEDKIYDIQVPWTTTFAAVQKQMNDFGFASVMMHPPEFTMLGPNHTPSETVNTTHIEELKRVIAAVKQAGWKLVTFDDISREFTSGNSGNQPLTTGKSKVTTGTTTAELTTGFQPLTTSEITTKMITTAALTTSQQETTTQMITTAALTTSQQEVPSTTGQENEPSTTSQENEPSITTGESQPIIIEITTSASASPSDNDITTSANGGSEETVEDITTGTEIELTPESSSYQLLFSSLLIIVVMLL